MFPRGLVADADALYKQYHRAVFAYLVRLTDDRDWAEDLLQETFYRAIAHASGYRGEASPLSWLCTISRNLYVTQSKRRARAGDYLSALSAERAQPGYDGPETAALQSEHREEIARVIGTLPENQRLALLLRDWDDLPYETIANILGLKLVNVKVTIHRARARFRERYREGRSADD